MIQGLSHMTFIVRDLDRMEAILATVLGARKVYDSGDNTFSLSRERFFLVGGTPDDPDAPGSIWIAVMEGESLPSRTYNHVAFKISEADYPELLKHARALGLDVREDRPRVTGEGRSIYFYDNDNHLFELHTGTLGERLRRYGASRSGMGAAK
jgi:catechol 2,3-dioxygenase-like lactoylglutathione lyase family enzyme